MGLYLVALIAIVVLALALLAAVALAAAARRGDDRTRFSRRMVAVVDHLNGEAPPPQFLVDLFTATPQSTQPAEPVVKATAPARANESATGSAPAASGIPAVVAAPEAAPTTSAAA